jgi:hypothetical protein
MSPNLIAEYVVLDNFISSEPFESQAKLFTTSIYPSHLVVWRLEGSKLPTTEK